VKLHIQKNGSLKGEAHIPGSKSHAIRAIFFNLLAGGGSDLKNLPENRDVRAAERVAGCFQPGFPLKLKGAPSSKVRRIFTGNSGLTTRFLIPILGLRENTKCPVIVELGEQMQSRPIAPLINALNELGMKVEKSSDDCLKVSGRLTGGKAQIDGLSSQYLSALLIALPCTEKDSEITVKNLQEKSYVDMTLDWLEELGIKISQEISQEESQENAITFKIPGRQSYKAFTKTITGDYSSAAFIRAAAELTPGSKVAITGLDPNDTQPDKALEEIIQKVKAEHRTQDSPQASENLSREIDCNAFPDLLPVLAVLATTWPGETHLTNLANARIKEADRLKSMAAGLRALGAKITELPDSLTVQQSQLRGAEVEGYEDHRTVMALAIAGLTADGETIVTNGYAIRKTFPEFVRILSNLGANIQIRSHITMIGFKSVGKTRVGRRLSYDLDLPFVDLDEYINQRHGESCRKIVEEHGEAYFRKLETEALHKVLSEPDSSVIALGGGTPMTSENRQLLEKTFCIHVTDTKDRVFQRIKEGGRPAFFGPGHLRTVFDQLWEERSSVYKELADRTFKNV
jgi:3-phosphoshikimate 1-carboxyvinyltransferase